jgi:hypothetical protein
VERIGKQLDLNEAQRLELKKLLESQQTQVDQLWNDQRLAPVDRMTRLRTLQEDTQERFHALLTGEQQKKYDRLVQRILFGYSQPQQKSETKRTLKTAPQEHK